MDFKDVLAIYLGSRVEVFFESGFYEGILAAVSDMSITVQISSGNYVTGDEVTLIDSKIHHIRVLNS